MVKFLMKNYVLICNTFFYLIICIFRIYFFWFLQVYTWGCNDEGSLGRETSNDEDTFTSGPVDIDGTVVQISAGDCHSAALTDNGRVYAWGCFRVCVFSYGTPGRCFVLSLCFIFLLVKHHCILHVSCFYIYNLFLVAGLLTILSVQASLSL